MIRFLIQSVLVFIANALGILFCATFLDGFDVNSSSFLVAVLVFTLSTVLLGPFIVKLAFAHAGFLVGGVALVTTFVGLLITAVFTDGLVIDGLSTWFLATVIIWFFAMIANVLLPFLVLDKFYDKRKAKKAESSATSTTSSSADQK